jgi:fructose/tagatose bisphosphate aldolase
MALVSVSDLLYKAEREGYAAGVLIANNMEIVQTITGSIT